jgi:NAD(P)-dependent dehydrogenase (short-subunit alcohol dehydrogenase family)
LESSLKSHAASLWSPDCMAGKVVLVTGAGRGIGRETALTFAALGASVMGVSRTEGELADLAREAPVEYLAESVDTVEGCAHIIDETRRRLGGIDILINNAGVGSFRDSPIWDMSSEVWRESMATNLDGPFELTRLAITDMIQRNWGRVVMVGSTAGQFAWPAMSSYCASKHGLLGLTRAVAQCRCVRRDVQRRYARVGTDEDVGRQGGAGGCPPRADPRRGVGAMVRRVSAGARCDTGRDRQHDRLPCQ